ncbi:MAG: 6-carboxytetrahydropterin synthase [Lachnospiraceae bacterium]|nr:6-carboxytetrahydropterin synthase [Lachnospiraceae bacterium]
MAKTYKQYKFKFYLNMNHYIMLGGKQGDVHPHTWEILLSMLSDNTEMTLFVNIEKKIDQIMERYQDKLLNECEPFDKIVPTVENAAKYFFRLIQDEIIQDGWIVLMLELSETPTRSYIINALFDEDSIWDDWYERLSEENLRKYPEINL